MRLVKALSLTTTALAGIALTMPAYGEVPILARDMVLISPMSAGTAADAITRTVADALNKKLGEKVIILNQDGASGVIAGRNLTQAEPDGHTVMIAVSSLLASTFYKKNVPYKPLRDFTPIGRIGHTHYVLVADAKMPVRSVRDLVAYSKAHPGQTNGAYGNDLGQTLVRELIKVAHMGGVFIHFRGDVNAINAVMSGHVQWAFVSSHVAEKLAKAGRVRVLAVIGDERSPLLPDVPTIHEAGITNFVSVIPWLGIMGPKDMSHEVTERISAALGEALAESSVQAKLALFDCKVQYTGPDQFKAFLEHEYDRWRSVTHTIGIVPQ